MIPININNETYFFSIIHITKQSATNLIYGISLNTRSYYLSKSLGLSDCVQLDANPLLDLNLLTEICDIITKFEMEYEKYPSLEFINIEIIKVLGAIRTLVLRINLSDTLESKEKLTGELKAMIRTVPVEPH
jgi:hypothetical protein